jgi:hypothetical protein
MVIPTCLITCYSSTYANIVDMVIMIKLLHTFRKELKSWKCFSCKWVSYSHQKGYHDPWCHFILVLSGKSSWVPSRTQGFVPTCCRWADVLRLLYQLPLSCDGRSLGSWAMVICYFSSDVFAGDDHKLALYFKILCVCVIWTTASATFIRT